MLQRRRTSKRQVLAYSGLFLLFAIATTVRVRSSIDLMDDLLHRPANARPPIDLREPQAAIIATLPNAAAAGLRTGDILRRVNGKPYEGMSDLYAPILQSRAGDRMTFQVERPAAEGHSWIDVSVVLPSGGGPVTAREMIRTIAVAVIMPWFCLLLAFWVVAVRIRDPLAWIVLFVLLGLAQQAGTGINTQFGHDDWFQPAGIAYHQSLSNGWPIAMMLFGLYFPERLAYDRRWPWAKWLIIGPLAIHLVLNVYIKVMQAHHAALAIPVDAVLDPLDRPLFALGLAGISFFFFGTAVKLAMTRNSDARRRLSLLLWGSVLSLSPVLTVIAKDFILRQPQYETTPDWLLLAIILPVFFFPLTLAYLIVIQRAMDVRVMIRQSMQYVLAAHSVRIVQVILIAAVFFAVALKANSFNSRAVQIALVGAGLMQIVLIQRRAEKVRLWVDRRFFREAHHAELILSELADKVRTIIETEPLLETVAKHIAQSLHVTRVALLLQRGEGFQPAYAYGYPDQPWVSIPQDSVTARVLERQPFATVYPDDEKSWIYRLDVSDGERRALEILDSEVLLALSLNQKLLGIMSLGSRQSEAPFSKSDLQMLRSVASQTGLALENSRLTEAVAAEVAQRERMNRELEIAREVQERLFPQDQQPFEGIDYAGMCRPALGVGGDYYDFIPLSTAELGIAVGDVSGKGIAAALLMASLRASLRGQTIGAHKDLARLMANVNRLVYESSTSNRYATFFYAQYDAASRRLTYVNAGHNPPLILRGSERIRLETGGPVVGLLPVISYQQDALELQPGDLFVAFTDGISEAMNSSDQEWGEENLMECAASAAGLNATEVMRKIMAAADAFAAGAGQHDDMTIVVARIGGLDSR